MLFTVPMYRALDPEGKAAVDAWLNSQIERWEELGITEIETTPEVGRLIRITRVHAAKIGDLPHVVGMCPQPDEPDLVDGALNDQCQVRRTRVIDVPFPVEKINAAALAATST